MPDYRAASEAVVTWPMPETWGVGKVRNDDGTETLQILYTDERKQRQELRAAVSASLAAVGRLADWRRETVATSAAPETRTLKRGAWASVFGISAASATKHLKKMTEATHNPLQQSWTLPLSVLNADERTRLPKLKN